MSIPTPEQAQELVDYFGGQRPAARGTGVPRGTLRFWLDPEKRRIQQLKSYHGESGLKRSRRLLRMRRTKALLRRAQREQRRATENG